MIICIVGKSGSGKSYICKLFEEMSQNIIHLDIDNISHEVLTYPEVYNELINAFGISVSNPHNKTIDRRNLGNIVFNSEKEMDKLTQITWPRMQSIIDNFIYEHQNNIILLDWQLLLNTKYYNLSNIKILVESPIDLRTKMTILRDNITKELFEIRDKASFEFNTNEFDYIINNDYSDKVKEKVKEIYDKSIVSR